MRKKNKHIDFEAKFIRDPLYGFIGLSNMELDIINTKVFRRLRDIKQLSHAYLVYPSAIHTRYEHSIGVVHLANIVSDHLRFNNEEKEIIRLAGLLHDVGHGPFSHLFESVLSEVNGKEINHDKISMMLINEDPEISKILKKKRTKKIIQLLDEEPIDDWDKSSSLLATDIISSSLDVDKMDYLRRDSYHIGAKYGEFDLPRLIHTLTHTKGKEKRICVDIKGMDAVEGYRLGRYLMHAQVYKHHTRLSADQMFVNALKLAINDDEIIDKNILKVDTNLNKKHKKFLDYYITLDDRSIYDMILKKPRKKSAKILTRIKERKLLKRVYETRPHHIKNAQIRDRLADENELENIKNTIAKEIGIKKYEIITHISSIPVSLYGNEILIMDNGTVRYMNELSPIQTKELTRDKLYIFADEKVKSHVKKYMSRNYKN